MARSRRKKSKRVSSTAQPTVNFRKVKILPKQGQIAIDDIRQAVVKVSSSMQAL